MPKKLHLPARDVLTCQFQDDVSSYPSLTVQSSWSNSPRLATWHLQVCLYRLPIAPRRDGPLLVGPLLPVPWPDSWFRCQAQPHNRRIKGTYSTWRYKSVRLPTGAPREQQLHSTYHLRGSVSLVNQLKKIVRTEKNRWWGLIFQRAFCAWRAKAISLMLHSKVHLISCHATPEKHLPKDISSYAAFVSYDERHNHTTCACAACTSQQNTAFVVLKDGAIFTARWKFIPVLHADAIAH